MQVQTGRLFNYMNAYNHTSCSAIRLHECDHNFLPHVPAVTCMPKTIILEVPMSVTMVRAMQDLLLRHCLSLVLSPVATLV
jgi:hypothetical protein